VINAVARADEVIERAARCMSLMGSEAEIEMKEAAIWAGRRWPSVETVGGQSVAEVASATTDISLTAYSSKIAGSSTHLCPSKRCNRISLIGL